MSKQAFEDACNRLSELTGKPADSEGVRIAAGAVSIGSFTGMINDLLFEKEPQIIKKCGNRVERRIVGFVKRTTTPDTIIASDIVHEDSPTCPCYSQIEVHGWDSSSEPFPDGTLCKHHEPGEQLKDGTWEWQCVYPEVRKQRS